MWGLQSRGSSGWDPSEPTTFLFNSPQRSQACSVTLGLGFSILTLKGFCLFVIFQLLKSPEKAKLFLGVEHLRFWSLAPLLLEGGFAFFRPRGWGFVCCPGRRGRRRKGTFIFIILEEELLEQHGDIL